MKRRLHYLLLFTIALTIKAGIAQDNTFPIENLTIENGLSSNRVTSFIQDRKGFLWIGTEDGLNRFDGYSFKVYLKKRGDKNSLSHNYIWSMGEDSEGNIWIATNGGGLNKFDPVFEKFYHYRHNPDDTASLSHDIVKYVYTDKQDNLWAGTWGGGLNLFNPVVNSFKRFKHQDDDPYSLSGDKIWCIYEDSKNNLWIGTSEKGLNLFNRDENKFKRFYPEPGTNSFSGTSAVALCEDSKGYLWIGTHGNGLDKYSYETGLFTNYKSDNSAGSLSGNIIWKILEDNQGLIWIATQGNGFNVYDHKSNKFDMVALHPYKQEDPSSNNVKDLFEDRSSVLWLGMLADGIKKIDRKPPEFFSIKKIPGNSNSLPEDFVYTLCEDKYGEIWIGTYSNLTRYSPSDGKFKTYSINRPGENAVSGNRVRYIFEDSSGEIWIGTYFGKLNRYNRATDSFVKYNLDFNNENSGKSNVRVIYEDSKGFLWIGTNGNGLIKFDKVNEEYQHYNTNNSKISGDIILSLVEDKNNNLWIGTFGRGLNKFDLSEGSFTHYMSDENNPSSLNDNSVTELYIDSRDNLWLGTFSGGLCRFDYQKKNFSVYTELNGLSGNYIAGILEDDKHNLWISTSKGISNFNPGDNSFKNYDFTHGLQKGEFMPAARLKTKNKMLYFGGVNGINYFHPDSLQDNNKIPSVVLTSFKVFNTEADFPRNIAYADTILLNYDENNFSFEFASLDYTFPERNKYAYMLVNFDKDWNYSDNRRFANYTHISPGEYLFKAKGTNSEGIWNEEGVSVLLIIKPPFWATWWFRGIIFLGFIGAVGYIYNRRISYLEREKRTQEEFSKRLIHSQEEERKRIASELHDSIGQNLLIIKNYASLGKKSGDYETGKKQFDEISNNAASAIDEVRRIAYNLHPYHLERLGLTNAIYSIIDNAELSSQINFHIKSDNIDNILAKETEINLFRVIQESTNNIIKHSRASDAEIIIEKIENEIRININDNGKGFSTADSLQREDAAGGFGLENLRKRINIFKGEFKINSEPGKGTQIFIKVPI